MKEKQTGECANDMSLWNRWFFLMVSLNEVVDIPRPTKEGDFR